MTASHPFVDRPAGPLDEVEPAAERAAAHWRLPSPQLIRLGMNALFGSGDVVLRVSRPNAPQESALELADLLTALGVRVPRPARGDVVVDGDLTVTAWPRIAPSPAEPDWREVGRMVARVHELQPEDLPPAYPCPPGESYPWWQFDELLADVDVALDDEACRGLQTTVDRHRRWSDGVERAVCHGDVHPANVLMTDEGPMLIDWDLLCHAPAAWDHAMLLRLPLWGWPAEWYQTFAAGYGRSMEGDSTAEALADLRLVAATLMRLRAGLADPRAMPEAQRRLEYWRAEPTASRWTAV